MVYEAELSLTDSLNNWHRTHRFCGRSRFCCSTSSMYFCMSFKRSSNLTVSISSPLLILQSSTAF